MALWPSAASHLDPCYLQPQPGLPYKCAYSPLRKGRRRTPCEQIELHLDSCRLHVPASPMRKETKQIVLCNKTLKNAIVVPDSIWVKARDCYPPPPNSRSVAIAPVLGHSSVLLFLIHQQSLPYWTPRFHIQASARIRNLMQRSFPGNQRTQPSPIHVTRSASL